MKKSVLVAATAVAGLISVGSIGAALAANHTGNDAAEVQALMGAKLTAADAAAAAEASIGGKVISVTLEDASGQLVYEVTLIAADGTEMEATVDAVSGAVAKVAATEDNNNDEQAGDQNEENGESGENGENGESGENGEG